MFSTISQTTKKLLFLSLFVIAIIIFPGNALMVQEDLSSLVKGSDQIVYGRIEQVSPSWNPDNTNIITTAQLRVLEDLTPSRSPLSPGSMLSVTAMGGTVGDVTQWVEDEPVLSGDSDSVYLLKKKNDGSFSVNGLYQGVIPVQTIQKPVSTMSGSDNRLFEIKRQISDIVAGKSIPKEEQDQGPEKSLLEAGSSDIGLTSTAVLITGVTPSIASAGTGTVITITGSGFGPKPVSHDDYADVAFLLESSSTWLQHMYANGYVNGAYYNPSDIVSWTDTEIKVRVPTGIVLRMAGNLYQGSAGSGFVRVFHHDGSYSACYPFTVTFGYMKNKWRLNPTFYYNPGSVSGAGDAIIAAANTWNTAGSSFRFFNGGLSSSATFGKDGKSLVAFGPSSHFSSNNIIAHAQYWSSGGIITEADVEFNSYWTFTTTGTASGNVMDIQAITTHELGHWLSLNDLYGNMPENGWGSSWPSDISPVKKVMFGINNDVYGNKNLRTLSASDIAGIRWIYPPPTLSGISPATGTNGAAIPVTITGNNFLSGATVILTNGTLSIPGVSPAITSSKITCSLPITGAPPRLWDLTVTNPGGQSASMASAFSTTNSTTKITAITPVSAFNSGTQPVTITGSGFRSGVVVSLAKDGSTVTASVTNRTSTQIKCTLPLSGALPGIYTLTVLNSDGIRADKSKAFTVNPAGTVPTISDFSPTSGANSGTLPVTINGTNFRTGAKVTITNGTTVKTTGTTGAGTQIKSSLPLTGLPVGSYDLTVTNSDGTTVTRTGGFSVVHPIPSITGMSPMTGYNTGSLPITITGSKFASGCTVTLNNGGTSTPGSVTSYSPTKLVATFALASVPVGSYSLIVANPGDQQATYSKAFSIMDTGIYPDIYSYNPTSGVNTAAIPMIIDGIGFRTGARVTIANGKTVKTVAASSVTPVRIKCSLPLAGLPAGLYDLTVTNTDGTSGTRSGVFSVENPAPSVTGMAPVSGYNTGPLLITITGSKFASGCTVTLNNGGTSIPGSVSSFSGTKLVTSFDLNSASVGSYTLIVTNPGDHQAAYSKTFSIMAPGAKPVITDFSPSSGVNTGSVPLTINGSAFRSKATVTLADGLVNKTVTATVTSSQMKCSFPLTGLPVGAYDLIIRNSDGTTDIQSDAFQVRNPDAVLSSISPGIGYNTDSYPVTITGKWFVSGVVVVLTKGGTSVTGTLTSQTSTRIMVSFPLSGIPAGLYDLSVTNPGSTPCTRTGAYTVSLPGDPAVITGITPSSGFNTGNLPVTITGSRFNKPTVYISLGSLITAAYATAGKVSTSTTAYATLPLKGLPGGSYSVIVRNCDGINTTAADIFWVSDKANSVSNRSSFSRSSVVQRSGAHPVLPASSPGIARPFGRQVPKQGVITAQKT